MLQNSVLSFPYNSLNFFYLNRLLQDNVLTLEEKQALKEKIEKLKADKNRLQQENDQLQQNYVTLNQQFDALEKIVDGRNAEMDDVSEFTEFFVTQVSSLKLNPL